MPDGATVCLATIPHTGTTFFAQLLGQHFGPGDHVAMSGGLISMHVTPHSMPKIREHRQNMVLVTTIRDWPAVLNSWERRGRNMAEWPRYLRDWLDLLTLDPIIVSVDSHREERLRRLERALGVEFKTDWTPVNAWRTE